MKRTTVKLEVELEGPTVSGMNFRDWLLEAQQSEDTHREDLFRVVEVQVLGEDPGWA